MKRRLLATAIAAAAAIGAAASVSAGPTKKPAANKLAAKDWTKTVSATPEGGFVMGNPQAPMKLIEYASFTCNHCAAFAAQGMPELVRDYVKTGKASLEYRTFIRDPYDVTAALLARCAPPAAFFGLTHRIFADFDQWTAKVRSLSPGEASAIEALPVPQRIVRLAAVTGFDTMAGQAGLPPAKVKQCLTDQKGLAQLVAMHAVAVKKHGVQGTPSFILNGKLTEAHNWTALQPLLGPPGG